MAKIIKKKRRKNPIFKSGILFMMLVFSGLMMTQVVNEVQEMKQLNAEIATARQTEKELTEKKKNLITEKKNLTNEEYILKYARGKYLVTGKDEEVFKLPKDK